MSGNCVNICSRFRSQCDVWLLSPNQLWEMSTHAQACTFSPTCTHTQTNCYAAKNVNRFFSYLLISKVSEHYVIFLLSYLFQNWDRNWITTKMKLSTFSAFCCERQHDFTWFTCLFHTHIMFLNICNLKFPLLTHRLIYTPNKIQHR